MMTSFLLKPSSTAAVVAMALACNPICSFQLPLPSSTATARRAIIALHEHKKPVAATELVQQSRSKADYDWLKKDLEKELNHAEKEKNSNSNTQETTPIKIIFSDIDGSLIHYPKNLDEQTTKNDNSIISLPPSATGLQGVLSSRTLSLCRDIRAKKGVQLVLVTGARTSTLLNRLPFLPKADAYCTESGGRIFYPTNNNVNCCNGNNEDMSHPFTYTPVEYIGANIERDLQPFGLQEDMTWRKQMEIGGAGTEGYAGNNIFSNRCNGDGSASDNDIMEEECLIDYENSQGFPIVEDEVPISQRDGHLWDFANYLVDEYGFVLDAKSYSTCFRVNKKHQTMAKKDELFDALLTGKIAFPEMTLGKSTNLGCIDFYPKISGKQNW